MTPRSARVCLPLCFLPLFFFAFCTQSRLTAQDTAPASAETTDATVGQEELTYSDAVKFKTWSTGSEVVFEVEMARPHVEGMFTCLHVYLDTDNKPKTGIGGAELWLRAALGSRYHPNSYKPKNDKPAMTLKRASLSRLSRGVSPTGRSGMNWLHTTVLPPPEIEPKKIRFKVRNSDIAGATRYGSVIGVQASVETTCSDQPVMLRHLCNDDGVTIEMDGMDHDWSHPLIARDDPGELHKVARFLDITSLRAEHDGKKLYACVELAAEGLRRDDLDRGDIRRYDGVTLYVEPMYPRYQEPMRAFVEFGRGGRTGLSQDRRLAWLAAVDGKFVEFKVDRKSGQNEFRVWVWSDLRRVDWISERKWLKIDWGKTK